MEFGVRGCCRGLQWAHCNVLRRLYLQEGICPERWESLERRRGYSIYVFGLAAAGGKATEAIMHDTYHHTKRQLADDDAQGTQTRRRQKRQNICISLEVMTQSEQPKMEENDRDGKKNDDQLEHEAEHNSNDRPYGGEWSMACWNAQGLLATSATKQHRKMARAKKLAAHRDILIMTETHGNEGKCRACRIPLGYKAFWGSSEGGEAGIGIWVRKGFLEAVVGDNGGYEHIDVDPGRTAVVRIWGPAGKIQIGMAYLQTGNSGGRAERTATMRRLAVELAKGGKTLNILAGDFNFVVDKMDRISGMPAGYTGAGDEGEAKVIDSVLEQAGLKELEQSEFTYRFETCRSRIDRIYTNMKRYEWLDRDIGCVALDWDDNTSRHRPIAGYRRGAGLKGQGEYPIQNHEVGGEEWNQRVKLAYLEKFRESDGRATAIQRLLMVKEMVVQVTRRMRGRRRTKASRTVLKIAKNGTLRLHR